MTTPILTATGSTTFTNAGSGYEGYGTAPWPLSGHGANDTVLAFIQYEPFATSHILFSHSAQTRLWQPTNCGGTSAYLYGAAVWVLQAHRVVSPSNVSDLVFGWEGPGWTAPPDRAILLSYSHMRSFAPYQTASAAYDYSLVIANSGTFALTAETNSCGGGDNVAWLVLHGPGSITCTWPAGCTEIAVMTSGGHTMRIAEQRVSGTGDWPAVSVPFTGGAVGGFQCPSLTRVKPAVRQDRDA